MVFDSFSTRLLDNTFKQKWVNVFYTYALVFKITIIRLWVRNSSIEYLNSLFKWWFRRRNLYGSIERSCYAWSRKESLWSCKISLWFKASSKHGKFDQVMLFDGFQTNIVDKCVYIKQIYNDYVILYLYVYDIMILGIDIQVINITISFLSKIFDMKNLGPINVILGIKLLKNSNGFAITQSHYIEKILKRFNYFVSFYVVLSSLLPN